MFGQIVLINKTGDEILVKWDHRDHKAVKKAKKVFDDLKSKGFLLFHVHDHGNGIKKVGEQVTEFQEDAEKIMARPAMAGG